MLGRSADSWGDFTVRVECSPGPHLTWTKRPSPATSRPAPVSESHPNTRSTGKERESTQLGHISHGGLCPLSHSVPLGLFQVGACHSLTSNIRPNHDNSVSPQQWHLCPLQPTHASSSQEANPKVSVGSCHLVADSQLNAHSIHQMPKWGCKTGPLSLRFSVLVSQGHLNRSPQTGGLETTEI